MSIQHGEISTEILEFHKEVIRPHHQSSEKSFISGEKMREEEGDFQVIILSDKKQIGSIFQEIHEHENEWPENISQCGQL